MAKEEHITHDELTGLLLGRQLQGDLEVCLNHGSDGYMLIFDTDNLADINLQKHADGADHLRLFQHRNKLHRAQQSSARRIITQKRLRPQQTVILTIDQRLIAEEKALAVVAHAIAQLILQLHPAQMLLIACLRKKDDFLMVILFRTFQRRECILCAAA